MAWSECWFWFVGERAGHSHLQLQLPGCRPGQDLWGLLVPGWQSVGPVAVAGQIYHPLQQGHAPPAATQQHAIQGLSVCKIFMILWYQPYEICHRCVFFSLLVYYTQIKMNTSVSPYHSEFPPVPLCSWQDSGPPVHPQRHGGCPELHLHRCHELPAYDGVLTSQEVQAEKICFIIRLSYSCIFFGVIYQRKPKCCTFVANWLPLQVLGRHWYPAEEGGVRKAGEGSPADQLLGQHPTTHVSLPQVSGLRLRPQKQTGHPGGRWLLCLKGQACLFKEEGVYVRVTPDNL